MTWANFGLGGRRVPARGDHVGGGLTIEPFENRSEQVSHEESTRPDEG
jgi:hypothetical protein